MIILVDVDGVVCDLHERWLAIYRQKTGSKIEPKDIKDWGFTGLEVNRELLFSILWDENLYDHVRVIPDSLDAVRMLRLLGHRIVFVTSSTDVSAGQKMRWLSRHGFLSGKGLDRFSDVVICHDKSLIKGDIMVDDHAGNFNGFEGECVLFDQPHNRSLVERGFKRCQDWSEVVKFIIRLGG